VADLEVARVQVDTKSCPPAKRDDAADPVDVACTTTAANPKRASNLSDDTTTAKGAHAHNLNDATTTTTTADSTRVSDLDDDATTDERVDILSKLFADTANAAFLEAAAELDDAWEPWVDGTVAAAVTESSGQNVRLKRHQPTTVWRVVSSEPHRHRSPVAAATTPTTHGQRGGHARPPPRRVDAGTGG
jgi:hypothetical protein